MADGYLQMALGNFKRLIGFVRQSGLSTFLPG